MEKEISKELFTFVKHESTDAPSDSTRGYSSLGKVLTRVLKNPIALVPVIIILLIILFSLLTPIFISRGSDHIDPYYAKRAPRIAMLGKLFGASPSDLTRVLSPRAISTLAAIGIGAVDKDGDGATLTEAMGTEYMPVLDYKEVGDRYRTRVDSYLEVGFVYMTVGRDEYERIKEYERQTGVPVLYPLIDNNEGKGRYDANTWYLTDSNGNPIDESGGVIPFAPDMSLVPNYLYSAEGAPIYAIASGGGNNDTAGVKIRVLYYNYYRYKNGTYPDYIMGTDSQGYDLALRLASGVRLSLGIAFLVSIINLVLGAVVGAIEGYYGGAVDLTLERVKDVLSGVPFIVVATLFQIHLSGVLGPIPSLFFAFVLTGWIGTASRMRAQFYRHKNSEYVLAARTLGASDGRIIWRHIFPNTLGTLITASALVIPRVIFSESLLSFLGIVNLGGEELTSLGTLLSEAGRVWTSFPHLILFPAAIVSLLMISFNMIGNVLREALQ